MEEENNDFEKELWFISGRFFDLNLPKDKLYLFKYFDTQIQRQFVRYYYLFGNTTKFSQHTGYKSTERWLRMLKNKYNFLERSREEARKDLDLEKVSEIESGSYKC